MNTLKGQPSSIAPISILLRNLRLLDLDELDDWPHLSVQTFTVTEDPQSQKTRIQCVEWICYRLYQIWDQEECRNKLQPFFPPLEPLKSINLRAALFRCLNEMKRHGSLGRDLIVRKSLFDDCKGETLYRLLSSFSTAVLRKVLAAKNEGINSIVRQLCCADNVPFEYYITLLPLAFAHRVSLTKLLAKKRIARARYQGLENALEKKHSDLTGKFEKIIEAQDFLDQNPPSESTLERISRILDQHWQGDLTLVNVILRGQENDIHDNLLDQEFKEVWPQVTDGRFDSDISMSQQGFLENLEQRVASQKRRLEMWKNFKLDLENRNQSTMSNTSLARQASRPRKSYSYMQYKEKDLVFSPRKSPRKSMNPFGSNILESKQDLPTRETKNQSRHIPTADVSTDVVTLPLVAEPKKCFDFNGKDLPSIGRFSDENNESSTQARGTRTSSSQHKQMYNSGEDSFGALRPQSHLGNRAAIDASEVSSIYSPQITRSDGMRAQERPNDGNLVRERLNLLATHASPTSLTSTPSLVERTRKSMALANPGGNRFGEVHCFPPFPISTSLEEPLLKTPDNKATLIDRTRQSISLVSMKPKGSRNSINRRHDSRLYTSKQFETPIRQTIIGEMTPPEELISPEAGYESVFKSRPKVACSPPSSPGIVRIKQFDGDVGTAQGRQQ